MFKLVKKYLKVSVVPVALIVILLICQAFADLKLPNYTSDIINTGIQNGGIEDCVPDSVREEQFEQLMAFVSSEGDGNAQTVPQKISKSDLERIMLFISDEQKKAVVGDYELSGSTYSLKSSANTQALNEVMKKPMAYYFVISAVSELTDEQDFKALEGKMNTGMSDFGALEKRLVNTADFSSAEGIWTFLEKLPYASRENLIKKITEKITEENFSKDELSDVLDIACFVFYKTNNDKFGLKTISCKTEEFVRGQYILDKESKVYRLKGELSPEARARLSDVLRVPEFFVYVTDMMKNDPEGAKELIPQGTQLSGNSILPFEAGTMGELSEQKKSKLMSFIGLDKDASAADIIAVFPNSLKSKLVASVSEKMGDMFETMSDGCAKTWLRNEYKAQNIDVNKIQMRYLFKEGLKMILVALVIMTCGVIVALLSGRTAARFGRDVRSDIFSKVMSFSNAELNKFSTASLITRSTNDVQQCQMVIVMFLRMVLYAPLIGIGAVIKVFKTNLSMSWIIGVAVLLIILVVGLMFIFVMPRFVKMQELVDRLNKVTREILTGLPVIRAFSTEEHEKKRFDKANTDFTKVNLFINRTMALMMPLMTLLMTGVSVLIVWIGAHNIDKGTLQVGDLLAYIQYTMQILIAFVMISMISIMLPRASVAGKRIYDVVTTKPSIVDKKEVREPDASKRGLVEFDNVSFKYPGAENSVLENISFTAQPGQTTAIIGGTGSGKSTVVNLIPRFFDVTSGAVRVDGEDVRDLNQHKLRELIGYVPQKGVLFYGTIDSNLRYGRQQASEQEVKRAAEIAQATEFIDAKPEGYNSEISQGGTNVSGGQKQRLSIARAIVKNPEIYIFDDSFSALDFKTDSTLRAQLNKYTKESTVIIVAQRISTIMNADKIIVLDEGKIVGSGTHNELMKNCKTYKQIALSQLSKEEIGDE